MSANQPETEQEKDRVGGSGGIPIDAVPDPALLCHAADDSLLVERVNRAFEAEFGHLADRLDAAEGTAPNAAGGDDTPTLVELIHPEDREAVIADLRELPTDPAATVTTTYRLRTGDSSWRRVRQRASTFPESDRLVATLNGVAGDEHGSDPADDRPRRYASAIAHDIRNPLQVASARLQFLAEESDSDHIEAIDRALDRIEQIVAEELALARGADAVGDREPVSLADAAGAAWESVATGNATLERRTDRTVLADRSRLVSVFRNLFQNAVEHGSTNPRSQARGNAAEHSSTNPRSQARGNAAEHSSTSSRAQHDDSDPGDSAVRVVVGGLPGGFYVADDGPGVPEDVREDIFAVGYSTDAEGTGLGLAFVREILESHGWEISVTDSGRGGARFEITGVDDPSG